MGFSKQRSVVLFTNISVPSRKNWPKLGNKTMFIISQSTMFIKFRSGRPVAGYKETVFPAKFVRS